MLNKPIHQIIPQQDPFVFVDHLISVTESQFISQFKPLSGQLLVEHDFLSEAGMMENMAQTAAAGMGCYFQSQNKAIPRGFIGAVKNFQIFSLAPVNQTITTKIQLLQEVFGVSIINAEIFLQDKLIASCEMKIVLES